MRDSHWLPLAPLVNSRTQRLLKLLGLLLLIYAALGHTGAHIGVPLSTYTGIYIGDLVLLYGLAVLMVEGRYGRFFALPLAWPWLLFFAWNAAQMLPYLSEYGLVAMRDGAIWGYSLFAVIVASQLIAHPSGFVILIGWFGRFARLYVYFVLIMMPASLYFSHGDITQPIRDTLGFDVPTVTVLMPHVTGAMAFVACRFVAVPAAWWWALAIEVLTIGTQGRGALMAFLAALIVVWFFNPWSMRPGVRAMGVAGGLGFMFAAMLILNLNFGVTASGRAIGPGQLLQNIAGTFAETGSDVLDGSRQGRITMWSTIIDYTVFGPYFWTGKGYGINLVEDAGFHISVDPPTRSPENSHLTLLARSGVPGLLLWVVLQSAWVVGILRALLFARRTGRRQTTGLMTFLLAYWTQFMVGAATSVVFEGPHGGIWFWTIFGVGAAAAHMVRRDADFFERMRITPSLGRSDEPPHWPGRSRHAAPPKLSPAFTRADRINSRSSPSTAKPRARSESSRWTSVWSYHGATSLRDRHPRFPLRRAVRTCAERIVRSPSHPRRKREMVQPT